MDLIYMNADKEDVNVMHDYALDLAFGIDENNFECSILKANHCCEKGFYLYCEGSEYGGIIDDLGIDTEADEVKYCGRTWHGILNSKILEPLPDIESVGVNLIPYPYYETSKTQNGITFTVNADRSVTFKGTATAETYFTLQRGFDYGNTMNAVENESDSNGQYTINKWLYYNANYHTLAIVVRNGLSVDETIYPMLNEGTEALPYKPYSEVKVSEGYLTCTGEANGIIQLLLDIIGLTSLFKTSTENSGINMSNYKMNRYIAGYDGIRKMLKASGAKLNIAFKNGFVELSAKPIVDYSKNEQFDADQISFKIMKKGSPLNHVICLGKGDLAEREVIHLYTDANGNITDTQVLTGILEVADTYENATVDSNELRQGGVDMIYESWNSDEIDFDFDSDSESYDVGDIVGAREQVTKIEVCAEITKKIVSIKNNTTTISYKVGE